MAHERIDVTPKPGERSWRCKRCDMLNLQRRWEGFKPEDRFTITCPECKTSFEVFWDDMIVGCLNIRTITCPHSTSKTRSSSP